MVSDYLNLKPVLLNELFGDPILYLIGIGLLIIFFGARSRLDFQSIMMMVVLFVSVTVASIFNELAWMFIILFVGFFFYMIISDRLNR